MSIKRINDLRAQCRKQNLDGVIVTHMDHVRYLTGFTGSNGLLALTTTTSDFLTDSRYTIQARQEVAGAKVATVTSGLLDSLKSLDSLAGKNRRFGFNAEYLTVANRERLQKALAEALLTPADSLFTELGWVKDAGEIANIRKAVAISDEAFRRILPLIKPGVGENELAAEMEYQMIMLGSDKPAFETIVASGPRSAMPHGVASKRKVKNNEFITFDFGATVNGYVSDMTRTVVVGKASPRHKKIYNTVLKAQLAGIRKIRAGVMGRDVDKACRDIINKSGYGKTFGHGTGHGIGYYIHVGPRLSALSSDKLLPNNVVTVEPGIYVSGFGGVRIEDDVLVTSKGGIVLNRAEKKLLEL
ncbi:MAG: aminopeptidase P family protein [candidate division Zixibacteria bacterium]|nr:aminopeptidase P family protein [candidate division Zixibacteria bacterium]